MATAAGAPALVAKGLEASRPTHLEFSAPTVDGEGGVVHRAADGDGASPEDLGPDASRAERRRAARAQRKRQ